VPPDERPVIGFLTDFGFDGAAAICRGVMLSIARDAQIVDISHAVRKFAIADGAYLLRAALPWLPLGVHVAVVDPGVGTPRDLVVALSGDQALLAPDNGLLAPLAARGKIDRIIRVENTRLVKFGVSDVSATFHGRDIFAPLAAAIASNRCNPLDLGTEVSELNTAGWPRTQPRADGGVEGVIVAVDRFGNLISNIDAPSVVAMAQPTAAIGGLLLPLRRTYGDANAGEYVGLINSFEVLEVARARGNAAQGLNLGVGAPISAVPGGATAQFRRS
jgi:S-adenosylmethionine hydrolase